MTDTRTMRIGLARRKSGKRQTFCEILLPRSRVYVRTYVSARSDVSSSLELEEKLQCQISHREGYWRAAASMGHGGGDWGGEEGPNE